MAQAQGVDPAALRPGDIARPLQLFGQEINADTYAMAHKKEHFLNFVDRVAFSLPSDYRFNRDELHAPLL